MDFIKPVMSRLTAKNAPASFPIAVAKPVATPEPFENERFNLF
jgi:hypothetical protein